MGLALLSCRPMPAEIRLENGVFRVEAPPVEPAGGWASTFRVYTGSGDVPPIAGSYAVEDGELLFRPRFPLTPGVRYRAVLELPSQPHLEAVFDGPASPRGEPARVLAVYPTQAVLPANQLKLYLHFSAPMSRGEAWKRLHLLDETGKKVELPFLEIQQELWDREYRRMTVLFDPGRIKRGLVPHEETGPPIEEGRRYTLVVDGDWQDARGVPLGTAYRKTFTVGPPDRTPINPKRWRIRAPTAGTRDPLAIEFGEPLDHALAEHSIDVQGVAGEVRVAENETRWVFEPREPWKPGVYRIVVDHALEDLAGNRIGRLFDVDMFDRVSRTIERRATTLSVRVR